MKEIKSLTQEFVDEHSGYPHLPQVELHVLKQVVESSDTVGTIEKYIDTITDISKDTKTELFQKYLNAYGAALDFHLAQRIENLEDSILSDDDFDATGEPVESFSGKFMTMQPQIASEMAQVNHSFAFGSDLYFGEELIEDKSQKYCIIVSDNDLELDIVRRAREILKQDIEVIVLKGDDVTVSRVKQLGDIYKGIIITEPITDYVTSMHRTRNTFVGFDSSDTLKEKLTESMGLPKLKAEYNPANLFGGLDSHIPPSNRGRKKGGRYVGGHKRF